LYSLPNGKIFFCLANIHQTALDLIFFIDRQEDMGDLTKTELLEMPLKLMRTDRNLNFLSPLEEKDLTTLLVGLRERIELMK